ncbi:alanine or glycine:cation symporter, AGCS family [Alphaproteobacteria bacterium]
MGFFMQCFFTVLQFLDNVIWGYVGVIMMVAIGVYLTIRSRFLQIKVLFRTRIHIKDLIQSADSRHPGVNPIKLYFASIGGMIGLGNLVAVVTTVTIGGPGSLVWMWLASFMGMIIKYSEIYLGIKYRVASQNGYDGGPMYYLQAAFPSMVITKFLPIVVCVLLCIYGAEVSQFLILTDTFVATMHIKRHLAVVVLLALVLMSTLGGVKRLAAICSALMPPFMISYIIIGLWVVFDHAGELPGMLKLVFSSAFTGHAALGGFAGSTMITAAHYGVSRAVYSGDIGIGYDSIVQSETRTKHPEKQARLAVFALFSDTTICTITALIVLLTGLWTTTTLQPSEYVGTALANYIPSRYLDVYMLILFFIAGFTTIIGYLVVGQKSAKFLHPKYGRLIYMFYAVFAFIMCTFYDQKNVMLLMSVSGGCLMMINLLGVFRLRQSIQYK